MTDNYNSYVHGTTAEKIEYDVYKENKVLREKKKYKNNRLVKQKAVFMSIIIFGACFLLMYRYAMITEINNNIIESEKYYKKLCKENSIMKLDIDKQLDINTIKEIAENRLGMQKPDRSQMVYLDIVKTDSTVVLDTGSEDGTKGSFASVMDKLGKFVGLLY